MLKNYFLTALRNMLRHKLYSLINIGGLTIGLAACILIFLFVQSELSYDKWIPDGDRIVRLETSYHQEGQPDNPGVLSPGPVAHPMARAFPGSIEATTRMLRETFIVNDGTTAYSERGWNVDNTFFDVFDLEFIEGNPKDLFKDFRSVVISERLAEKYFGDESAVGKTFDLDNGSMLVKIVAVMKELPEKTHLYADLLIHFDTSRYENQPWVNQWWVSSNVYTYMKLTDIGQISVLEKEVPAWYDENAVPGPGARPGVAPSEMLTFSFMPVTDIHLHSRGRFQIRPTGDIMVVYSFTAIAGLILLIAVINFTNLSTARASLRAKEIAMRKVVGATRGQLMKQFLGEAILTTSISLLCAFVIVELALPWFNDFVSKILDLRSFGDPSVQAGLLALVAVVGLGAGAHPALKLSSYRPAKVLHSRSSNVVGSTKLRAILTTLQFTISIGLMITTGVIYSQIKYAQSIESGFEKSDRMFLGSMSYGPVREVAKTIRAEIDRLPGVEATSFSDRSLPLFGFWDFRVKLQGQQEDQTLKLENVPGDFDFLNFYGAELVAGRMFSKDRRGDLPTSATEGEPAREGGILNETAVKHLGFASANDALGKVVLVSEPDGSWKETTIIGVVKDMYLRSLRDVVDANLFVVRDRPQRILNIHYRPEMLVETRREIEAIWQRFSPEVPMNMNFVEDTFAEFYSSDEQRAEMFAYFSLFAIFVSCLGLYGLASFTAERRVKEIGIRKVMGAKVSDVVKLLTFQFSKPVLAANVIAWPVAWYFTNEWLSGFIYRIDLSALYFVGAGLLALVIACLTVAGHAFKTANANPVYALRHE